MTCLAKNCRKLEAFASVANQETLIQSFNIAEFRTSVHLQLSEVDRDRKKKLNGMIT